MESSRSRAVEKACEMNAYPLYMGDVSRQRRSVTGGPEEALEPTVSDNVMWKRRVMAT